jgi:hypothetical protein
VIIVASNPNLPPETGEKLSVRKRGKLTHQRRSTVILVGLVLLKVQYLMRAMGLQGVVRGKRIKTAISAFQVWGLGEALRWARLALMSRTNSLH